jgi:GDPmannose 4,6-dehydratase
MAMPTALITGVAGQDGSYLAEFLLSRGYRVIGLTRDAGAARARPYGYALREVELVEGALLDDAVRLADVFWRFRPDEIYHLAGPSRVATSWEDPAGTQAAITGGTGALLEAVREAAPSARCFNAGSCEMFSPEDHAQDESAPRRPESPYGRAKLEAFELARRAREERGLHVSSGILFNHESPRRGAPFVTRRIARGAAAIARGHAQSLRLGNLDVRRDWGFAGDFVRAMWLMLQQSEPDDLVIGTGVAHSVAEFCEAAFGVVGLSWTDHVVSDPALFRPSDPPLRLADPARARVRLGWTPEVDFHGLVAMMVDAELKADSGSS